MSDKKQQEAATDTGSAKKETEDRTLWEYLERAERSSNEPMFYELAETLSNGGFKKKGADFVN